ncbi:MAG: ABC transporter permease [Candidatus Thorarchaeota archaeon]|nr:MAG: ABC transporter permease [Candidatus Thorarchaeota archaeon]
MNLRRILALVKKDLKKTHREPAVLFILLIFPVVLTFVFGLAFGGIGGGGTTSFDVGLLNLDATSTQADWSDAFTDNLTSSGVFVVHDFDDNVTGQEALLQGNLDAFIVIPEGFGDSVVSYYGALFDPSSWDNTTIGLYVDSGSLMAVSAVPPLVQQVLMKTIFGSEAMTVGLPISIGSPALVESSTFTQWDFMAPGIFAFAAIFLTMIVAQSMTYERDEGLLKRLRTTPVSSADYMISQTLTYMIIAVIQVALVLVSAFVIGYRPATGPAGIVFTFVIAIAFSLVAVGFGLIAASISKSAEVSTGVSFMFIMPQMFFGTFMPLGGATEIIGNFMPSKYITDALTTLFLRGAPVTTPVIWYDLAIVSVVGVLLVALGIYLFEKFGYR